MRFPSPLSPLVLLSSALLLSTPTSALVPSVAADVCVSLAANLGAQLGGLAAIAAQAGIQLNIQLCLCLDLTVSTTAVNAQLNGIIAATPALQALANIPVIGSALVRSILLDIFNSNLSNQCPSVPSFGHRICNPDQTCGIQCDSGFTYNSVSRTCDCPSPKNLCGSTCQVQQCGSNGSRRRSPILRGRERCERKGYTFCPVQGAHNPRIKGASGVTLEWECLNTASGLESCGGCPYASSLVAPVLFSASAQASNDLEIGVDCSAILNIDSVTCLAGKCIVEACAPGWKVSRGRNACERR